MSREMSRDRSHSARDIDVQPATIDVSDEDAGGGKLEKTPSHSLPAVALAGTGGRGQDIPGGGGGGGTTADGVDTPPAFVDVDDIAMHVDRDPYRWHDTVRVSIVPSLTATTSLLPVLGPADVMLSHDSPAQISPVPIGRICSVGDPRRPR